jgi:hypothetical protein
MRMLVEFECPLEPFNSMVKNGTAGDATRKILGELKPESVYFTARNGKRGGVMVVDLADASRIPTLAEPFFQTFNATVTITPCMTPEDLGRAGLDELGRKWA